MLSIWPLSALYRTIGRVYAEGNFAAYIGFSPHANGGKMLSPSLDENDQHPSSSD
jgi:hypothetical protein